MEASLIIPFYKDLTGLELILTALNIQSAVDRFEVIIAEDDNNIATIEFLKGITQKLHFPVKHISQPDEGFRKCKALNEAIKITNTDYLIFIDGDCIPHRHFIKQYLQEKEENKILYGRRVNLSEAFTATLKQTKNLKLLTISRMLLSGCGRVKEALYLPFMPAFTKGKRQFWGCNWAILKKHMLAINGYDEDYNEYGFEDLDIYKRMEMMGYALKSVKYQCIVYHLYHTTKATEELMNRGKKMFDEKMKQNNPFCKHGIIQKN